MIEGYKVVVPGMEILPNLFEVETTAIEVAAKYRGAYVLPLVPSFEGTQSPDAVLTREDYYFLTWLADYLTTCDPGLRPERCRVEAIRDRFPIGTRGDT
jgi:hypothetical protein